eukprot:CAMPEP_0182429618 /NCGR_PEP_ID=MMETSP1167-20130531/31676_1 /TAXON_ID=2988 /ORGANISM="Mallomonas Sp, Strain CCMP3275" /LENGTH=166 /DNA_ID=CAMNT_0024613569 /DNA_START=29 /DNA_END=529 /DNA_ORIENTATION=+
MRVTKKFAKCDNLGMKFKFSTNHATVEFNNIEQLKLPLLERSYRLKDVKVQSNRLRRKKYYMKDEDIDSPTDPIGLIGGKRIANVESESMVIINKNDGGGMPSKFSRFESMDTLLDKDQGCEMSLKLSRSESMDTIFDMDIGFEFENLTFSDNLAMCFISDDALMM